MNKVSKQVRIISSSARQVTTLLTLNISLRHSNCQLTKLTRCSRKGRILSGYSADNQRRRTTKSCSRVNLTRFRTFWDTELRRAWSQSLRVERGASPQSELCSVQIQVQSTKRLRDHRRWSAPPMPLHKITPLLQAQITKKISHQPIVSEESTWHNCISKDSER